MKYLSFFVFINGMAIMAIEMASSRFLAPYFGTSTIVWANIIGVIMCALALGYGLGGKISDIFPQKKNFYLCALLGASLLSLVPFLVDLVVSPLWGRILSLPFWEILGSFFVSILFFGLPVAFLAMLSPYAVRIASTDTEHVGSIAGRLSAWATVGSILGVYGSTFYTIPFWGVRETLWACACILMVLALVGLWGERGKKAHMLVLFIPVIGIFFSGAVRAPFLAQAKSLVEKETLYQHVRVTENGEGDRFLLFNEGGGIQSVFFPKKLLTGFYYDYYPLFQFQKHLVEKKELSVLIIGYAGGTIGKLLHAITPKSVSLHIDGVEIDPEVSLISEQYMGVLPTERTLYTQDGRSFLKQYPDKSYDIIIIDAYTREQYIPPHLITKEFFSEVATHINKNGRVLLNINAKDMTSPLLQTTSNTLTEAFSHVDLFPVPRSYNYILSAGNTPIEWADTLPTGMTESLGTLWKNLRSSTLNVVKAPEVGIFTDNKNAVEHMTNADVMSMLSKL